ncbi:hypothetical protein, partial [Escherichia coli]|uniref:hypothetical protein n=1 Tax=Escherichia coli TaxID=562 RepID=UPI00300711BF
MFSSFFHLLVKCVCIACSSELNRILRDLSLSTMIGEDPHTAKGKGDENMIRIEILFDRQST